MSKLREIKEKIVWHPPGENGVVLFGFLLATVYAMGQGYFLPAAMVYGVILGAGFWLIIFIWTNIEKFLL